MSILYSFRKMVLFDKFITADLVTKETVRDAKKILDWNFSYVKELEKIYFAQKNRIWQDQASGEKKVPDARECIKSKKQ